MSRSTASAAKRVRRSFTGEPKEFAGKNLGRRNTHGLDDCSPEQRSLRAVLALMLLNQNTDTRWSPRQGFDQCDAHQLLAEPITFSPGYDELTILTRTPHRLIQKIVPCSSGSWHGILGVRCLDSDPSGRWYRFVHLPTGGLLRVRYHGPNLPQECPVLGGHRPQRWVPDPALHQLTDDEQAVLDGAPAIHPDAERLLAGLVVRLSIQDPQGQWALGQLTWDPLERGLPSPITARRYLWGEGTDWVLHYNGPTPPTDIAAALTNPNIGIAGATATTLSDGTVRVRCGDAVLGVSSFIAPYDLSPVGAGARAYW